MASIEIKDVYKIAGIGIVPVGIVKEGVLAIGMTLTLQETVMTVKSIEHQHKQVQQAQPPMTIGIGLENGEYDLLKSSIGTTVMFQGKGVISNSAPVQPAPNHPKGLFNSLRTLFKK